MIGYLILFCSLILATVSDIRKRIIPDKVHIGLLISGAVLIFGYGQPWKPRVIAFALFFVLMLTVGMRLDFCGGDMKMMTCIAFALGFLPGLSSIIVSLFAASIYALLRKRKNCTVPLAPFLSAGCTVIFIIQKTFSININF